MTTTANYIIKATIKDRIFIMQFNGGDVWSALEEFWHEDWPDVMEQFGGGDTFPLDVYAMDGTEVIATYAFTFNAAVFHAFYDHGHKADGIYTLNEFAKDISLTPDPSPKGEGSNDPKHLREIMDRWAGFCYNHPPYDKVILWMVGGSKEHYLYQHFCQKWLHLCNDVCHNDTMATWIKFYRTLDSQWAERLMEYVFTNDSSLTPNPSPRGEGN